MTKQKKIDKLFIDIADRVSQESKCISLHVGAILVKDNRIISIGYNGTPPGFPNCDDAFEAGVFSRSEHHQWSLDHEIHAEMNAIFFAAKEGISTAGCTLYITHEPCDNCLKNCISAGISRIVYKNNYTRHPEKSFCRDFRDGKFIQIEKYNE